MSEPEQPVGFSRWIAENGPDRTETDQQLAARMKSDPPVSGDWFPVGHFDNVRSVVDAASVPRLPRLIPDRSREYPAPGWSASGRAAELRTLVAEQHLRGYRRSAPDLITVEWATAELARYRDLFPDVPVEVAAFGLAGTVEDWRELSAIRAAVRAVLADSREGQ